MYIDLDYDDHQLIRLSMVELTTSSGSLDRSPKKNWVEHAGNLPPYVRKLARAIEKDGKSLSQAIAIAISRVKAWAAGGDDVDADTRAKAAKALAQWEKLKASNKSGKLIAASRQDGSQYVELSNVASFNTDMVRSAWYAKQDLENAGKKGGPWRYLRETWTDFIIYEIENVADGQRFYKVPYTVEGGVVSFGAEEPVQMVWKTKDGDITANERALLSGTVAG